MTKARTRSGVPRRTDDDRFRRRMRIDRPRFTQAGRRTPRHGHSR